MLIAVLDMTYLTIRSKVVIINQPKINYRSSIAVKEDTIGLILLEVLQFVDYELSIK